MPESLPGFVQFLDKFDTPVMRVFFDKVVDVPVVLCNGVPQVHGVQIVPASCRSSELSSHQMAIRSHTGVQKMPANGISSELSAHQMAPAGAIAHLRAHLCPRASVLSFSSSVAPLWPLGLGFLLARGSVRSLIYFDDVTDAGPASHRVRLWQGGPASTYCRFRWYCCLFAVRRYVTGTRLLRAPLLALPEVRKGPWPLRRPRGDGNGGRFVRSPCLPSARFALVVRYDSCFPLLVPVQRWSIEFPATAVGECRRRRSL